MAKIVQPTFGENKTKRAVVRASKAARQTGMQAAQQYRDLFSAYGGVAGFRKPDPGTYEVYRRMAKYPTIVLAEHKLTSDIISTPWTWISKDETNQAWLDEAKATFGPVQHDFKRMALLAIRFGWRPFEIEYDKQGGIADLIPLLVDISTFVTDNKGAITGLRNQAIGEDIVLSPEKYFVFKLNSEVEDAPYGAPIYENARQHWSYGIQSVEKLSRYLDLQASVIAQIHYPEGTTKQQSGADRNNFDIACQLAQDIKNGKTVVIPNKYTSMIGGDDMTAAKLEKALMAAGKAEWVISFLEPGGADRTPGFLSAIDKFDVAIVRAFGLPEKSVLEPTQGGLGQGGVSEHDDTAVAASAELYAELCKQFNDQIVNRWLANKYGNDAVDALATRAPKLDDQALDTAKDLVKTMLTSPTIGPEVAKRVNLPELLDTMAVPETDDDLRETWSDDVATAAGAANAAKQIMPFGANSAAPAGGPELNSRMARFGKQPAKLNGKKNGKAGAMPRVMPAQFAKGRVK